MIPVHGVQERGWRSVFVVRGATGSGLHGSSGPSHGNRITRKHRHCTESGVLSPGRAGPLTELQAQKSSLEQQGIVIPTSPATGCCLSTTAGLPKAVTAFVMAGTRHTQELPMPQRSTSPELAAQTEFCPDDINPAISTQTWPPAHWP